MKKQSGWIGFGVGMEEKIYILGSEMYPAIYKTKKDALKDAYCSSNKIKPPQPVKIEWMVEK